MKNNYYDENSNYYEKNNTEFPDVRKNEVNNNYNQDSFKFETEHYKNTIAKKIIIGHVTK